MPDSLLVPPTWSYWGLSSWSLSTRLTTINNVGVSWTIFHSYVIKKHCLWFFYASFGLVVQPNGCKYHVIVIDNLQLSESLGSLDLRNSYCSQKQAGPLEMSSTILSAQSRQLQQQLAQVCMQSNVKYLQGVRRLNLSEQPLPLFGFLHTEKFFCVILLCFVFNA